MTNVDAEHMIDIETVERANLPYGTRFTALIFVSFRRMELQRLAQGDPPIASLTVDELIELAKSAGTFSP